MGALLTGTIMCLIGLIAYAVRVNQVMWNTPPAARRHIAKFLSREDIQTAYERVKAKGIDWRSQMPARRERRYIIVGGSGE